jgi:FkbM family methyltransferase
LSLVDTLGCYEGFGALKGQYLDVSLRGLKLPVRLRNGTSDFDVFRQVFAQRQYQLKLPLRIEYIVDAGANIGLASLFLLQRFPNARVIAIEPDPENFAVASHNLRQFADRCDLIHGALWHTDGSVQVARGSFGDGRHWATQTLPVNGDAAETVPSWTLQSLLGKYAFPRIDLLKIDIEGAELAVFDQGDTSFLDVTQVCAVECHGDACREVYVRAASQYGFYIEEVGELTVATRTGASQNGKSSRIFSRATAR